MDQNNNNIMNMLELELVQESILTKTVNDILHAHNVWVFLIHLIYHSSCL